MCLTVNTCYKSFKERWKVGGTEIYQGLTCEGIFI